MSIKLRSNYLPAVLRLSSIPAKQRREADPKQNRQKVAIFSNRPASCPHCTNHLYNKIIFRARLFNSNTSHHSTTCFRLLRSSFNIFTSINSSNTVAIIYTKVSFNFNTCNVKVKSTTNSSSRSS